ncbi:lytic transglycosylase domain-containing protein [Nocardioides sp.]|uniref:lytic transglycosylase domain-containing protein n=1 Tax=Nocardioides sp. TaxID=35761 RepID=UPI002ED0F2E9
MAASRSGRFQKVTTLLPLALLSAAVTASLTGVGVTSATAEPDRPATLPDGTSMPGAEIAVPASVSSPDDPRREVDGALDRAVATASASGIPAAALAAYQRAETVINAADKSCHLSWQLLAAIGRVESDHGRFGGNTLDDEGLATPGIYGIALNGKNGTQAISDTDAGQYDSDSRWDRAVGPMQFIPSTWSVVGVDGDNDGKRNPQDIDDAALASAVYLCSGKDDLSTEKGQRAAVYRYNHSDEYVDLVLAFMKAYLEGDFTSVPNGVTSVGSFTPSATGPGSSQGSGGKGDGGKDSNLSDPGGSGGSGNGGSGGGGNGGGNPGGGGGGGTTTPTPADVPDIPLPPVEDVLTEGEATIQCLAERGVDSVLDLNPLQLLEFNACMDNLGF